MTVEFLFLKKDGSRRINCDLLYPPFLERVTKALEEAHAEGSDYYPTSGYRDFATQKRLHEAYVDGKGTRAAPAGLSAHQYGTALDCAPDGDLATPGLQPDYRFRMYKTLIEKLKKFGLVSGVSFGDTPHVQIPKFVSGRQLRTLRDVYLKAEGTDRDKVQAVWKFLDRAKLFE